MKKKLYLSLILFVYALSIIGYEKYDGSDVFLTGNSEVKVQKNFNNFDQGEAPEVSGLEHFYNFGCDVIESKEEGNQKQEPLDNFYDSINGITLDLNALNISSNQGNNDDNDEDIAGMQQEKVINKVDIFAQLTKEAEKKSESIIPFCSAQVVLSGLNSSRFTKYRTNNDQEDDLEEYPCTSCEKVFPTFEDLIVHEEETDHQVDLKLKKKNERCAKFDSKRSK